VHGHWRYLYRAIDRSGALADVMFSEHRDIAAAKAFFQSAKTVTDVTPDRVTTDGHDSYRLTGSVEATMNCVTSSAPAPALINKLPPTPAGSTSSAVL
jgi:transposase-like protein